MSDLLERLLERRRRQVTLSSGLKVTGHLPDLTECMEAGDIPLGVISQLDKAVKGGTANGEVSSADLRHVRTFHREVIKAFVDEIEDEPVEMTDELVAALGADDRAELVAFATREKALPGNG